MFSYRLSSPLARSFCQALPFSQRIPKIGSLAPLTQPIFQKPSFPKEIGKRSFSTLKPEIENVGYNKASILITVGILSLTALAMNSIYVNKKDSVTKTGNSQFTELLNTKVLETIQFSEEIPGLNSKEFASLKSEILKTWKILQQSNVCEVDGSDQEARSVFVALQAIIEHAIARLLGDGQVARFEGHIHTPAPATPFCMRAELSPGLVHSSVQADPRRLLTVPSRAFTVREIINNGGKFVMHYPREGLKQRTEEQQQIYRQELLKYPLSLSDQPFDKMLPLELTGATYFFRDSNGQQFLFGIKMTQANSPLEKGSFGLYFGPVEKPVLQKRVKALSDFLKKDNIIDQHNAFIFFK